MSDLAWSLPGPRRFADAVADDLERGRSALVFLPESFIHGLRAAVKRGLVAEDWRFIEISALELMRAGRRRVLEALSDSLGLTFDPRLPLDVAAFVENQALSRRVLYLDLRGVAGEELPDWVSFLEQHAAASRERPLTDRSVVCALCGGGAAEALPRDDVSFARHWWWGTLSRLDMEVYVTQALLEEDVDPVLLGSIVEVASFDLGLADVLVDSWSGDLDALAELLMEYAEDARLEDPGLIPMVPRSSDHPPHQLLPLWSRGGANRWAELDPCLHSALSVVREGRELGTRVWRGQVRSLLPELELERQRMAEWVTKHRRTLPDGWAHLDVAGLEIGPMCKLIAETPSLRSNREMWRLAVWLRDARNSLAHLNPIDSARLQRGRELIARTVQVQSD